METKVYTNSYKNLKKLKGIKDQLKANTEWVKHSQLEDRLYKQLKELAKEMIDSVQRDILKEGYYKDAGKEEVLVFMSNIDSFGVRWNFQQRKNLKAFMLKLVYNLKY